jgi:hypothetical protein
MDNEQKLRVYQAQVKNVRAGETSTRHVRRSINAALRDSDGPVAASFTKLYAILFCSWAEANFSKTIHTPYGFSVDEIQQIQTEKSKGIGAAWIKAIELGARHLNAQRGSFRPNAIQRLTRAITAHVFDPSILRNKLAHGQWDVALNRSNDDVQTDLTALIAGLDIVKIDGWKSCHQQLAQMVETLIESPKKVFVRDWWAEVQRLDERMQEASTRQLNAHVALLKDKDRRTRAAEKRRGL